MLNIIRCYWRSFVIPVFIVFLTLSSYAEEEVNDVDLDLVSLKKFIHETLLPKTLAELLDTEISGVTNDSQNSSELPTTMYIIYSQIRNI